MNDFRVIVGSTAWLLSGVNTFSANLVRGLRALGVPAEVLITGWQDLPGPPDLELSRLLPPGAPNHLRWDAMISYLEERAPCVYVANDYLSSVSAKLSRRVVVVGIVHSDDPLHYEHARRLGKYWDAIVAGSKALEQATARLDPTLVPRLVSIPYGTWIPERCPERPGGEDPALKIVYASRLSQVQKRVLDLPGIAAALADRGVPFRLTVLGDGEDRDRLLAGLAPFLADGRAEYKGVLPAEAFPDEVGRHDVFLLTSDYEGMPIALLDAMGRGCVPVVTDIPSGIPELVSEGVNGYRVPVGDLAGFADRLAALQRDPELRRGMSLRAHEAVSHGYRVEDMAKSYLAVFRRALENSASGAFVRPRGRIEPPAHLRWMVPTWKDRLPGPVRALAGGCKRALRRMWAALFSAPV